MSRRRAGTCHRPERWSSFSPGRAGGPPRRLLRNRAWSTDRIDRRLAPEHVGYIGRAFALQLMQRLDRVKGDVRSEDEIVPAEQGGIRRERFRLDHIERGASQVTGIECFDEAGLV